MLIMLCMHIETEVSMLFQYCSGSVLVRELYHLLPNLVWALLLWRICFTSWQPRYVTQWLLAARICRWSICDAGATCPRLHLVTLYALWWKQR